MVVGARNCWLATRCFIIGCKLLLLSSPALAAELTLTVDKTESEMGKYFVAEIRYQGEATDADFNLAEWTDAFHPSLQNSQTRTSESGGIEKTASVRLYPRRTGVLTLSSIAYAGLIAPSQQLTVGPSIRQHIDATPVLQPIQSFYWADQAILIRVDVALHDPSNRVEADEFELDGFKLQALQSRRRQQQGVDIIQLQWMLITPRKGHYEIELPAIHQRGRGRFRYHLPTLKLQVKPLPAYLPATIPVGRIEVQSELIQARKQPAQWLVTIQNSGYLPPHVEGMEALFEDLGIDPAQVERTMQDFDQRGRVSQQYRFPVPEWTLFAEHTIQIPYFDTDNGQLSVLSHALPEVWQLPPAIKIGLIFLLTIGLFYAANQLDRAAQHIRRWKRLQRQIRQADSAHILRRLLLETQQAKTLGEWTAQYPRSALVQQIAQGLNQHCFAACSLHQLAQLRALCLRFFTLRRTLRSASRASSKVLTNAVRG